MARLVDASYGKSVVRLTKVLRDDATHVLYELSVQIMLTGSFERVYTHGDNAACIPTDTMKNTVYALAARRDFDSPEGLGAILASHFLEGFSHVVAAEISVEQTPWARISVNGKPHGHSFAREDSAVRTATVRGERGKEILPRGGLRGLEVMKTTGSGFAGFLKDAYTTLAETSDRILATSIDAEWDYSRPRVDFNGVYEKARRLIPEAFAVHDSRSVQHTIFAMGQALLEAAPEISRVRFTLPNRHRIPVDLAPFGVRGAHGIFAFSPEPFGLIRGTVSRD